MRNISLLVWLSQLGLSVAVPPVLFIMLAVWLRERLGWGVWVIWLGVILGIYCAVTGLISALRTMERMSRDKKQERPPVAFNDHQ